MNYKAFNIYRIWVFIFNKIIITRNVKFNEMLFFNLKVKKKNLISIIKITFLINKFKENDTLIDKD